MKFDFDILSIVDFEEMWINEDFREINLYFIGPKEPISDIYPEAEHFTIHLELVSRTAMISPTKEGEDYDWSPLELDSASINRLIAIAALRSNANKLSVLTRGTDNHMFVVDLHRPEMNGTKLRLFLSFSRNKQLLS